MRERPRVCLIVEDIHIYSDVMRYVHGHTCVQWLTSSRPKSAADSASFLADSARAAIVTTFALSNWLGLRRTLRFT